MAGRGRGRGRPPTGPIARDDDGNPILATGPVQPPPLFPTLEELPPLPDLTEREQHLLLRRRQLNSAYRSSPYFIEAPKEDTAVDIQRYSDRYTKASKNPNRPALNSVMTLTPANFPTELYGKGGKGRGKNVLTSLMNVNKASEDLLKLEELAQLERKYAAEEKDGEGGDRAGKDADGEGKDGKAAEDGEGEEPEEEEMEEDEYEDDDYMQGYNFDDDDGYDDDDGGGDDDEAVF